MENLDKVKARIAKILAKAENNSNPHEAAIAASKARRMMDQYQLEECDIIDIRKEVAVRRASGKDYAFTPKYRDWLAVAVGKYNDCWVHRVASQRKNSVRYQIEFSGLPGDVDLCEQMWSYLCDTVDALCKMYMKSRGYTRYVASVGDAFKKSCATEIVSRLHQMTSEREAIAAEAGTALMVIKNEILVREFGEESAPVYKTASFKTRADLAGNDAVMQGRIAGRKVEIVKAID